MKSDQLVSPNKNLLASVVIPVRNRPELLSRALDSLLKQDINCDSFEIIVCDDGSDEEISEALPKTRGVAPKIKLVRMKASGPAAARNRGIETSRAEVVAFVDSDVVVNPDLLRKFIGALELNPHWVGAEAAIRPIGTADGILWDAPVSISGGHFHTAAIAYRREILEKVGGFDEEFKLPACEDVELAQRALQLGEIGFVEDAIAWHPRRRVTLATHWKWRSHWFYETILAQRYGFLAFPGKSAGEYPRLAVARAAVISLPAGRFIRALRILPTEPLDATRAMGYAIIDAILGLTVLPSILFRAIPPRRDYLRNSHE
jgi:glycosyltransferase involved in cell wall biosynthesis